MSDTPPVITLAIARDLLARAVSTQGPDFRYVPEGNGELGGVNEGCFYHPLRTADANDPRRRTGCIVGTALKLHGVEMNDYEGGSIRHRTTFEGTMTDAARYYFFAAQRVQDRGWTWGEAYRIAEEAVPRAMSDIAGVIE